MTKKEKEKFMEMYDSEFENWTTASTVPAFCTNCGASCGDLEPDCDGVDWPCPNCEEDGSVIASGLVIADLI